VRCADPFVGLHGHWITRRLSPDCSHVELSALPAKRDELQLLSAMGWETANIHLGTVDARKHVGRHLSKLKPNWLLAAAKDMEKAVSTDWHTWRKSEDS
jgi:hypothetical protein